MKKITIILFMCLIQAQFSQAQEVKSIDVSPLDFAVFRPGGIESMPVARIIYSRPYKKGRTVFGKLVPYGKIWRTGANQSTEINVYRDIVFNGKKLKAGSYTLYTIPNEGEWTIIFNSKLFTWGTYDYDESKDILRFKVPVTKTDKEIENFGIAFAGENGIGKLLLAWDNIEVYIPFRY